MHRYFTWMLRSEVMYTADVRTLINVTSSDHVHLGGQLVLRSIMSALGVDFYTH